MQLGLTKIHRAAWRAVEEPVAGLAASTSVSERGGGGDGGQGACGCGQECQAAQVIGHRLQPGLTVVSPGGAAGR